MYGLLDDSMVRLQLFCPENAEISKILLAIIVICAGITMLNNLQLNYYFLVDFIAPCKEE
jgi:hypothetical protein